MQENQLWQLIDGARAESKNVLSKALVVLEEKLSRYETDQILRFDLLLHELLRVGYRANVLAAAYVINAGCDEEEFENFLGWLIMQGQQVWTEALKNPDSLAALELDEPVGCMELWSVSEKAYETATGLDDFEMAHHDYQPLQLIGNLDNWMDQNGAADEEKLAQLVPNLYQKYYL